ncbi:hypothetical protein NH514_14590 [Pseudoalteromonas sp. ACER1]|uniref:hypothetical protein n=1 Tax=unclassified Pseudoalteromonas TaxID=194690 RepID=UPI001F3EE6B1|nr:MULTISPECIES: hypothetical protein [unclassified Pseudoalteromonas]MCF2848474.1 hypothetical protein [Pseudoalteromonas sp. PAST1]MCO7211960.1 hypothetical protein [Pseudoalteromonas sp. ACER1]
MTSYHLITLISIGVSFSSYADNQKEVQDMSDPLAVYTQIGFGTTNKGLNLKVGQAYDTGIATTAGMNVIEVKGIYGDALGWESDSKTTDSIDSFRFRNFSVDLSSMSATQIDANYNLNANLVADESMDVSYSFIKALKPMGRFTFYPLAGVGASLGENTLEDDGSRDSGYSIMGAYGLVGMYAKVTINDKIWLNYNPFWLTTIGGSDNYKDHYYGLNQSHILIHEFAASYQINPRMNLRYFANWNENVDFVDGDHRLEFNYQL